MRIEANTDDLLKQIDFIKKEIERKLEGMVSKFIYNVAFEAIEQTPYGDYSKYEQLYLSRQKNLGKMTYGLTPMPGHAKGGWVIEYNKPLSPNRIGVVADGEMAVNVKNSADYKSEYYKLGDTVYIQNNVPYMFSDEFLFEWNKSIESGSSKTQAPDGIMKPVTALITATYKQDLKRYFEGS